MLFLPNFWTIYEAHFHLDGHVNSKEAPTEVSQSPLHSLFSQGENMGSTLSESLDPSFSETKTGRR